MSPEGYSDDFYKGPAYALVIGISNYKNGQEPGQPLGPNQFTNLKYAAKDAGDFAEFLKNYGFIEYNVQSLIDDEADLTNIKQEFENLRRRCQESADNSPLVVVFYSGHGISDSQERHYLIPWEADRDKLRATAFWNKSFSDCLAELNTNRLVVFIDACHAGAIGMEDAKDAPPDFDLHKDLGEGTGRYIIASCGPGERSWEGENNGIFTGHLLELLEAETDDIKEEKIDIFNLYPVLKEKVKHTALQRHGVKQEPVSQFTGATGIVLAINKRARENRLEGEKLANEERLKLLEAVCGGVRNTDYAQKTIVSAILRQYVEDGEEADGYREFYRIFDESPAIIDEPRLKLTCRLLIKAHERVTTLREASNKDSSKETYEEVDQFVDVHESKVLGSEEPRHPRSQTSPTDKQQEQRQLTSEDREYILSEIETELDYFSQTRTLRSCLSQPVSQAHFSKVIHSIASLEGDAALDNMLQGIIERFRERWAEAKVVESQRLSDLIMEKKRDD